MINISVEAEDRRKALIEQLQSLNGQLQIQEQEAAFEKVKNEEMANQTILLNSKTLNQLKIERAGKSRAGFRPGGGVGGAELEEADVVDGTTSTVDGTTKKKKKLSGDIVGVQSKVRNITINIEKMVENISFNNITSKQSEAELVEMIKRSLLTAVNDVNVIART